MLTGFFIAMVISLSTLDLTTIKYIRDNDCTDGVLQISVGKFYYEITYTKNLIIVTTVLVAFSAFFAVFSSWKYGPFPSLKITKILSKKPPASA